MAKTKNTEKRRGNKHEEDDEFDKKVHFWNTVHPSTIRGIAGVALFVSALLLLLSALGMAGVFGGTIYRWLYYVFGVGYYVLPILLTGWAWSLFHTDTLEATLRPVRATGAVLFLVSLLAIVGLLSDGYAGLLGELVAKPMKLYLELIASLVILAGLLIVSLLLLFDSELWVLIWRKCVGLFKKKDAEDPNFDETVPLTVDELDEIRTPESTDIVPTITQPVHGDTEETLEEFELDDEISVDIISTKNTRKKKAPFVPHTEYIAPPIALLDTDKGKPNAGDTKARANIIKKTLQHFKIPVEMGDIIPGPTVTQYSLKPAAGVRLNKIVSLQSNLELALAASPIRIEAPIPGRSVVGIEVPNMSKSTVGIGGLLASPEFIEEPTPLFVALGKDIAGAHHYGDIGKMPHLLVAGTTGSGKSVMIHSIVASLLYRNSPERMRLILVDPKRVELTLYDGIPHLLTPVVTDAKKCILTLKWAAKEMDKRYDILRENKVQSIGGYHEEVLTPALATFERMEAKGKDMTGFEMPDPMPHIVIIIDELADIMTSYPRELEGAIVRLAQMSRAVGIHLILSTQRPSKEVITGLIKANIPTRIALKVSSLLESRIILDQSGAEKLLGKGDMLYLAGDMAKPRRLQSPFLTTSEVKKITLFLKENNAKTLDEVIDIGSEHAISTGGNSASGIDFEEEMSSDALDEMYEEVRAYVIAEQKCSTSLIQRRFRMGYGRAARILDQLEERGVIARSEEPNRPPKVLIGKESVLDSDEL